MGVDSSEVRHLVVDLSKVWPRVGRRAAEVLRKTAFDIEADAKLLAPVDTGNLRNSISTSFVGDGRFAIFSAEIGPTAEYGAAVEFGVPHPFVIRARDGGLLRFVVDGRVVYARQVTHPPSPPRPYMRPAADRNEEKLVRALAQVSGDFL